MNTNRTIVVQELRGGKWEQTLEMRRRVYSIEGISPTIVSQNAESYDMGIKIKVLNEEKSNNNSKLI